jgi:Fe-S-cluster containining protein
MKENCNIRRCGAQCCYNAVLPVGFVQSHSKQVVNPVRSVMDTPYNPSLPPSKIYVTSAKILNNKCPFLRPDHLCAVYDDRPEICRRIGGVGRYDCGHKTTL